MANENEKAGGGGGGQAPASLGDLQRMTDEIGRMVQTLRDTQASGRRVTLMGMVVLVAIMLGFALATYLKMSDNLTKVKLQEAAAAKFNELTPLLQDKLQMTLHDVVPFYMQVGRQRLKTLSPKLEGKLKEEADKLGADIRTRVGSQIDARFETIAGKASDQLGQAFPALSGDAGHRVADQVKQAMMDQGQKLRGHVEDLATAEIAKMNTTLNKFPLPDVSKTDSDALVRQFLHSMIMMADYELLSNEGPPSLDVNKVPFDH